MRAVPVAQWERFLCTYVRFTISFSFPWHITHSLAAINHTDLHKSSQIILTHDLVTMPFGDITNKLQTNGDAMPIAPKKSAAPLACIANGNLRSRRVISDQAEKKIEDECMQDASAIMSVTPTSEMSDADISMASANARGDTTVTMREPTSSRSSESNNSEESDEVFLESTLEVL